MAPSGLSRRHVLTGCATLVSELVPNLTSIENPTQVRPEILRLSLIKRRMQHHLSLTVNLTCIETVERTRYDRKGKLRHSDRFCLEVAFTGGEEVFAWPGERRFRHSDNAAIVGGGMVSTGVFLSIARAVFQNRASVNRFAGEVLKNERILDHYRYSVPILASGYRLTFSGHEAHVAFSGSFWADNRSHEVIRLTTRAEEIPPNLPVREALQAIDYGRVKIGEELILLPQLADEALVLWSGEVYRNRTEFSHWKEYRGSSQLFFYDDEISEPPPPQPAEVVEHLQPGLRIKARLASRINSSSSQIGDEILARVTADVRRKKQTIIPAGAAMIGRIRWLDRQEKKCLLGIEFFEIRWGDNRARFFGHLEVIQDVGGIVRRHLPRNRSVEVVRAGRFRGMRTVETFDFVAIPGVALLTIESNPFQLSAGVHMSWITTRP
jgi:hypothetical protein